MRDNYIPQDEGAESIWAQNFKVEAAKPANSTAMGWDAATVTALTAAAQDVVDAIASKDAARNAYLAAVAAQDARLALGLGKIRPAVASGKKEATYTDAIGQALGVIGPEVTFDQGTYQAELRGVKALGGGVVEVRFGKARGQVQAVRVRMRRGGQAAFTTVGTAMRSPWVDHTPLAQPGVPEVRDYEVVAVINDVEVGLPSQIVQVTVTP